MAFGQFSASLVAPTNVRLVLYSDKYHYSHHQINILDEDENAVGFSLVSTVNQFKVTVLELKLDIPFVFGKEYHIFIANYGKTILNINDAPSFPNFDEDFHYEGELGALYMKEKTTFRLWAPLASRVILKYYKPNTRKALYTKMVRLPRGVYELVLDGDQDGVKYNYLVLNSGIEHEVSDPYAKSSNANGKSSFVIDLMKTKVKMNEEYLPHLSSPTEAIIYETSVRDQTNDERTDIVDKATFAGMIETKRTVKGVYPAGFDYLTSLGITHLQLMPVYDFKTVDENDKWSGYNWGYDPQQYFVLEGSFARFPNDLYNRINDFKALVAAYHKAGIRIVMDVVFNHVYEADKSVFEKVVPNFYFRKNNDGTISNGSGCGNDFATERPMVRRLVVEAALYYVEEFSVDGFRFDLMGLIDRETLKEIETKVLAIKPDFLLYGEGWEMATAYPTEKLGHHANALKMENYGFFNDSFRDIVKGPSFQEHLHENGYMLGAPHYRDGFCFAYGGSVINSTFTPKYLSAKQSINYAECHDNGTIIDKLSRSAPAESVDTHLNRLLSLNTIVMLSFGVPFFHRGQEIGVSKFGDLNSYKSSDKVNQFPYTLAYKRQHMVEYFKALVALRKDSPFLRETDPEVIKKRITFVLLDNGNLKIVYNVNHDLAPYKQFEVYINISDKPIFETLEHPLKVILNRSGYLKGLADQYIESVMIAPHSVIILGLRKDDKGVN